MAEQSQEVTLEQALRLGVSNMEAENYRVAILTFQDILKSVPDHFDSLYYLGLAYFYTNNLKDSIASLEAANQLDEAFAESWCNYGIILDLNGQHEEAVTALKKGADMAEGDYSDPYWNLSNVLWKMNCFDEAEDYARQSIAINPNIPEAWLNLGTACVSLGKQEEAKDSWLKSIEINPDISFAWNNLGNLLREMGELQESEEKCRKAITLDPNNAMAYNNLAIALTDLGNLSEAEENYKKAIALKPAYKEAQNNLSICLMAQSRFDEAVIHARYATTFDPNFVDAYINLSAALNALGDFDGAENAVQIAVNLKPDSPEVLMHLVDVLLAKDRYGDAEVALAQLQQKEPDSPRAYIKLATILERANKIEDALEAIDQAVALNPEMPNAYIKKGQICHISNRIEEAEACLKKAMELAPNTPGLLISMAEIAQSRGNLEEANGYIEKAKEINPNTPGIYLALSKQKKFTEDDPDFKKMVELEAMISSKGLENASTLNFALYSAYENIGNTQKAFEHLKRANDDKRRFIPYQQEKSERSIRMVMEHFDRKRLDSFDGKGYDSDVPVFILGMPRSGTTLTEQIISSHSEVFGAGELHEFGLLEKEFNPFTPDNAYEAGKWYVDHVRAYDTTGKAKRITDKMPGNYARLGHILGVLPNAKIIHCRRDPVDTCLSCYKQNFARGQYWSYNLEELAHQYKLYEEIMQHWRDIAKDRFIEIQYEETVSNLEETARKMINFIGLDWDPACLEPHKQKRSVLTASKTQVIKPVYKSSVKSWKKYEEELQPLINGLKS